MKEQTRAYIYRILLAVGTLIAGYGIITGEELALWLGVVVAALNVMPTANTPTNRYEKNTEEIE